MQRVAGFTGRELMFSVLPPTLPSIVRLPGRRESGTSFCRSAGRNAKMSDQPRSSAAPVEAYFDARRSPSAGLRDEAEAKQREHEHRTESRAEPEVRIQFPPADSPSLTGVGLPRSKTRAFPAGVRAMAGGAVARDGRSPVTWRRAAIMSLLGQIPVPQRRRSGRRLVATSGRRAKQMLAQLVNRSRVTSVAHARPAGDASAPAACLRSDRVAGGRRGSPG